uniref:Nodule Cysteine-Rich (NCR) secreted peptide n=1 Tax=Parastrongyloides trichosuri TaxID=131310 RepID=A0A0N4ZC34_PARTI
MILNYFTVGIFYLHLFKCANLEETVFKFICGNDPYRFFSHVPCEYYQICPNGGFDTFIKCDLNKQCTDINTHLTCVVNRCCTLPNVVSQVYLKSSSENIFKLNISLILIRLFIWIVNDLI